MSTFENPLTFVRSMKGAPISILVAFMFARKTLTNLELQQWTAYRDDAITPALRLLCSLGWLVAQTPRGPWSLADGRQLPLMEIIDELERVSGDESGKNGFIPSDVVVNDLSLNVPTITTLTTTRARYPEKTDSSDFRTQEENSALAAALNRHKIAGKKRRELIECEWVNAEYVNASVKYALDERSWDNPVGIAINRMLDHMEMPEAEEKQEGQRVYKRVTAGTRNQPVTINYTFDVDQEAADFTGHKKGCGCMDCAVFRSRGKDALCPDCKRFYCECEDEETEGDQP